MSVQENNQQQSPKAKKSGKSWARDATFFGLGFVAGAGTTVAVGVLTERLDLEPKPAGTTSGASTQGGK
jgi:hypothetical protein